MLEFITEQLPARGFKIIEKCSGMIFFQGPRFRIRAIADEDKFQVGMEKTFDRWANSVDYEDEIAQTEKHLEQILEADSWARRNSLNG